MQPGVASNASTVDRAQPDYVRRTKVHQAHIYSMVHHGHVPSAPLLHPSFYDFRTCFPIHRLIFDEHLIDLPTKFLYAPATKISPNTLSNITNTQSSTYIQLPFKLQDCSTYRPSFKTKAAKA